MRVTRGLHNLRPQPDCVLTIGNFDGVHRGHRAVLQRLRALGDGYRAPTRLLTFEPHPRELLAPQQAPARLTRFREKMHQLRGLGIDEVVCARFDRALASLSPQCFVERVLVGGFAVGHLLVGDDFRFGHAGAGDFEMLRSCAERHGFELSRFATVTEWGERVSSTRIRSCLTGGEMGQAAHLLGRAYGICGRVERGRRLGHTIGFPTANMALKRNRAPLAGVFAVHVVDAQGTRRQGVANLGRRPTVDGTREQLEVHVLDFEADLYGRELRVEFLARLRDEQRFAGLEALKAQIGRDVEAARVFFATNAPARAPAAT